MERTLACLAAALAACAAPPLRPVPAPLVAEVPAEKEAPRAPDRQKALEEEVEILVTGRRVDDPLPVVPIDSVGSRDVFGPERIRETGAREINDLVQNMPAISTRPYNGGEASAPSFSMRGLPDDGLTEYINVLIDGVPSSPLPYGWSAFSFLPVTPDRLFAIDYVRGAHSVRYSPNTVGGILNFVTTPIPDEPTFGVRGTFGNKDYVSTMVSAGGPLGDVDVGGTFVDRRGGGYRDDGGFDQLDYNGKLRWNLDDGRWLAVSASYMEDGHQAPGGLTQAQFEEDRFGNARPLNRFDGHRAVADVVYHDESGGAGGWWEAFAYGSDTKRHLRAQRPHFGTATDLLNWNDTSNFYAVGARASTRLGEKHTLFYGARYHQEWIDSWEQTTEAFPGGGPRTVTRDSSYDLVTASAHVDDTWRATEKLTVQAGARLEWVPEASGEDAILGFDFDDEYFDVLPGVGAAYEVTSKSAVFANWFEGFRPPQVWGFGSAPAGGELEFEDASLFEFGVRGRDWGGVSGAVTAWRTDFDDYAVFYSGFYENLGRIVAEGIDFEVDWKLGRTWESMDGFSIGGSFTVQDSELREGPNEGNETPYAWERKAAWYVRFERGGWVANLGGTYVGDSFSDEANTATDSADGTLGINPSRVIWDARVGKFVKLGEKGRVEVAVGATNLFDKEWYVHSRGGFFGGGLVAGPPLQAYASFDVVLNW